MRQLTDLFDYLVNDKNIPLPNTLKDSFSYCVEYFKMNKNLDLLDDATFDSEKVKSIVSSKTIQYEPIDKKKLKLFKDYLKHFIDFMENKDFVSKASVQNETVPEEEVVDNNQEDINIQVTYNGSLDSSFSPKDVSRFSFQNLMNDYFKQTDTLFEQIDSLEKKEPVAQTEVQSIIYDLIHSQYVCFEQDNSLTTHKMPTYFISNETIYRTSENGYYDSELYTTYSCFDPKYFKDESGISSSILASVFNDVHVKHKPLAKKNLCVIPDSIDEFNLSFRRSIMSHNHDLFLIPQSILYAIHISLVDNLVKDNFAIINLDGEEPTFFEFRKGNDCLIRRGRKKIDFDMPTYKDLAKKYLKGYSKKNNFKLSVRDEDNIINQRLLDDILIDHDASVLFETEKGAFVVLEYDDEICQPIYSEIEEFQNTASQVFDGLSVKIFYATSFAFGDICFNQSILSKAYHWVLNRIEQKKPIWKEEMPRIEVEVLCDGKKQYVRIIDEGITQDIIIGYSEDILFQVKKGVYYLRAFDDYGQVATHTDIPMRRDVIGAINTNKKAVFNYNKPLERETKVKLTIKFNYNNENIFNLIAEADDGRIFESSWENPGRTPLGSKVYADIQKPTGDEVRRALDGFKKVMDILSIIKANPQTAKQYVDKLKEINRKHHYPTMKTFRYSYVKEYALIRDFLFNNPYTSNKTNYISRIHCILYSIKDLKTNYVQTPEMKQVIDILIDYVSKFSCIPIYATQDEYSYFETVFTWLINEVADIKDYKRKLNNLSLLSKEIPDIEHDMFHLFSKIKEATKKYNNSTISCFTRDIAAYAWDSKGWLPTLYKMFKDTDLFDRCYDYILDSIKTFDCEEICIYELQTNGKPSLSKVRDQLECALAFINIRDYENLYFNPDEPDTDSLKEELQSLNEDILECCEQYKRIVDPRHLFRNRLTIKSSDVTTSTVETIYILNKALDGQETIVLRFEDD